MHVTSSDPSLAGLPLRSGPHPYLQRKKACQRVVRPRPLSVVGSSGRTFGTWGDNGGESVLAPARPLYFCVVFCSERRLLLHFPGSHTAFQRERPLEVVSVRRPTVTSKASQITV